MAAPLSPLQERQWRSAAQRDVRVALNAITSGQMRWDKAHSAGRASIEGLSNALLEHQVMAELRLGPLEGSRAACLAKLEARQMRLARDLEDALGELEASVAAVSAASEAYVESLTACAHTSAPQRDTALFTSLTPSTIAAHFQRVAGAFTAELRVKRALADDVLAYVEADRAADASSKGKGATSHPPSREALLVHVATWVLQPKLTGSNALRVVADVRTDMQGW
ncbi:unnamed protein product [Pedinophyceae sp. YPF-701]|nr:unnamed protein product [Pedinophyceae sp. YPF-701]